ncbi:mercury(II) reductase [Agromyces mediolanus]|jgi:mercuric reductase|uniref:mercury(II) reductase n=1 Tax=Microbacteriaceae TaxID=85023 RepID=UPI00095CC105|nr:MULTISPECIES: mercury(II) reductase [Microbacteriaceae]MBN9141515.1 mercury(II) reductase [Micrococcales bacterium]MBN9604995.1 mercury(II) reductase [Actinomycetales bacterium]MBX3094091.1 mercury(II) reductase [Cryobacterium sp.]MCB1298820.1 mercury(II) reductase [Microthrixaceae bacterium]OJX69353.1 MAG: mercury(II) reductase [Micrococcales bacterium 72-143]
MTQHSEFDLAVIGTGGAAMSAAIHARLEGASVVAIERGTLGGTCVNVGCVPSKTLLAAAHTRHAALANPFPGAPTSAGTVDLGALVRQKDDLVGMLRQTKYADIAAAYGFDILPGAATFTDPATLLIDERPVRARSYLVAIGAEPHVPAIPGLEHVDYLTSTTAMELTELPASLVVIGGGFVGLEQAQLFARLGVAVTIIGRLAPHAEPELSSELRKAFLSEGITVVGDRAATIIQDDGVVRVRTRTGKAVTGERVLIATGRTPRANGLDLAAAGVATDDRGFIIVDEQQRTTNPVVFAAGDVTDVPQYVYVAAMAGKIAARNALGHHEQVDYTGLPSVLFTAPQLGSAGITEAEAIAAGYRCACRYLRLSDVPRAITNHNTRGGIKIVADADTGKVLGVHALAETAGEMMLAATYAIKAGFTVTQLADTWAPYLTMAEGIRLTANLFRNELPTSCCA